MFLPGGLAYIFAFISCRQLAYSRRYTLEKIYCYVRKKPNQQIHFRLRGNGCLFMWGAYFCMGAYKPDVVVVIKMVPIFMGACFLWVLIIPILQYVIMYCVLLYHKVIQLYSMHSLGLVILGCVYPDQRLILYSYLQPIQCSQ